VNWRDQIKWDEQGLVAAIAQDVASGRVLMVAWMNQIALEASLQEGRAVYWSRSRNRLWRKGEDSGHVQRLHELRLDCDGDAVLLRVEQTGGIACHTGRESCFYRVFDEGNWRVTDEVLRDPAHIYGTADQQREKNGE
jgi:phosphoribosyl-AMP cyclohydrolase